MKTYPMRARIRNEGSGPARLDVYDDIGPGGWFSDGVTAKDVAGQLAGIRGPLDVHISSSGGDVFDGLAIADAIRSHPAPVTTYVDGLAASIASVIAQAGQKRVMAPGAMMMIHDAWGFPDDCNEAGLLKMAATLGKVSDNLAEQYAGRAGGTPEQWRQAMQAETWYTADEAVAAGLADEVAGKGAQLPAGVDVDALAARAPVRIMAALRTMPKAADAEPDSGGDTSDAPPCKTCGGSGRLKHPGTGKNGMSCPGCDGTGTYDPDAGTGQDDEPDEGMELQPQDRVRAQAGKPYEPQPYKRTSDENVQCPACQKFGDDDARYCGQCGTQLTGRTDVKEAELAPASNSAADDERLWAFFRQAIRDAGGKVDNSPWDGSKANGAAADDPASFYAGICAGRKEGDADKQDSWALPYKYAPGDPPNAAGVKNALARLPQTQGLTNEADAKKTLEAAMKQVNPDWEPEDSTDTVFSQRLRQMRGAVGPEGSGRMTVAIPETPEQLEEAFNDEAKMQSIFAEGNFGRFTHAYMKMFVAKNTEDVKQHREKLQVDFQDFMRNQADRNGARLPEGWKPGMPLDVVKGQGTRRAQAAARYRGNLAGMRDSAEFFDRQGLFSPAAVGAAEDIDNSEYTGNLKQFVWATIKGDAVAKRDGNTELAEKMTALKGNLAKALEIRNAGMAERVPSEGGFLVPENLRSEMLALSLEEEVMRPEATIFPMDSLRVPLPSIDDTSHTSSVFGGVSALWTAEGAALKSTAPSFSRLVLQASKLTAFTQIPNELLQDSATPMDVWFRTFFPMAMSFFADLAFLTGNGVDQPEGLINCPGAVTVDPVTSATITLVDVIAMLCRLWPPSLKRARWVCSPDALKQLLGMGLVVTTGGTGTPIAPPSMLGGYQAIEAPGGSDGTGFGYKMLGIPLRVSEKVPYPNTGQPDGALTLYDPTGYLIGDRQAMQVASSAEYAFANDEVSYRITQRMDGRGWQRTALTPANGGATLSMIVKLGQTHT